MGCFQGIPNGKVDHFFQQMFISDITMPHTHQFLSPITFSQFLDRNQIRTFNPLAIYDEANDRWRQFVLFNPGVLEQSRRTENNLDLAEQPSENSWHVLIDFFRRMLLVDKIKDLYMKMHYMAHVCREFLGTTSQLNDMREIACTRAIFTQITGPVMYDSVIPAQYCFLPIRHHTDAMFVQGIELMKQKANVYISGHSAQNMMTDKLDESRCEVLKKDLYNALQAVSQNKDDLQAIKSAMITLANNMKIYRIDQDAYEMSDVMYRDGLTSIKVIHRMERMGDKYIENQCMESPDVLIDGMLDVWSMLTPHKKKTVLSRITRVFKKPDTEDMENDVAAIKRKSKRNPS